MARRTRAVSALSLVVLLGAASCGTQQHHTATRSSGGPSDARPAACGSSQLGWKMTLLPGRPRHTPTAMLSAAHKGSKPCAFDGYPGLEFWVGKGPSADAKPERSAPVHLVLNPGHRIGFPVFYDAVGSPSESCDILAENDPRISVTPPHPAAHDYGSLVRLTDPRGHHVRAQVCGPGVPLLGAPQLH
ncbi:MULTISPECIES: DUF4232 domain-containing protein [unclassified Streptomyces]|uniref:DUF4232 domain-containing protein n=1 Tax=unclassified Streptomyces TaxID=2593676 RepID=UPI003328F288